MNTEGSLAKLITAKCKEWLLKTNKGTGEAILKKKKPIENQFKQFSVRITVP